MISSMVRETIFGGAVSNTCEARRTETLIRSNAFCVALVLFLFSALSFANASAKEGLISGVKIEIEKISTANQDRLFSIAEKMISIKKGDTFSEEKLNESITSLKKSELFEKIAADSEESGTETVIVFKLKPARLIKDIIITGSVYPLFEKDILGSMSIYAGETYKPRKLTRQSALVVKMLEKEGYINPYVNVTQETDPSDGYVTVFVDIKKDDYWAIGDIKFKGNSAFSDFRLGLSLETSRKSFLPDVFSRFSEVTLKKETQSIIDFYRVNGYADVDVKSEMTRDKKRGEVDVIIRITEGAKYETKFRGNKEYWDITLHKDLVLTKDGNKHNLGIRKSIKNIKNRYLEDGFLDVSVKTEEEISEDGKEKKLFFVIDEGPRTLVRGVKIEGNSSVSVKDIEKNMLTKESGFFFKEPYNPETLEGDAEALVSYYKTKGFMNARVEKEVDISEDKTSAIAKIIINERPRILIRNISFKGHEAVSEKDIISSMSLRAGDPFSRSALDGDEKKISALISEKGYPHVSVKSSLNYSEDQKNVDILFSIDQGIFVKMGGSYFYGNIRTRDTLLRKELGLAEGDPFSLTRVLEAQKSIRSMDIFNSVQFRSIGLAEKSDTVHLLAEIEEKKPYYVQAGLGYDSQKGLYSTAEAGDHNLFGKNKQAWISGEASQTTYKAETGVADPRFTGFKLYARTRLYVEQAEEFNQDFGTRVFGSLSEFEKKWTDSFYSSTALRLEQREQYKTNNASEIGIEDPRKLVAVTPAVRYDTRDSFISPKKGMEARFSVDLSRSIENSYDTFQKYRLDLSFYKTPLEKLTLAMAGRFGYIASSSELPSDQLFFLGGTSSVRGFKENELRTNESGESLGGRSSVSGTLEARFDMASKLELITFFDTGSLGHYLKSGYENGFRSSLGAGIGYKTPIGPLSIMYGHKLDRKKGEDSGCIHFSVGYVF